MVVKVSDVESSAPIFVSLRLLKKGDFEGGYKALGVSERDMSQDEFLYRMRKFEEGVDLFMSGQNARSVEPMREAIPLVEVTNDKEARFLLPTLANFAEGASLLFKGDAHGAVELLSLSAEEVKKISFFIPGMEKLLLSFEAAAEVAVAKTFINTGDIARAEISFGKVYERHKVLLSKLQKGDPKDVLGFVEVYATRLENSLLLMRLDIEVLDFESLEQRVEFSKPDSLELGSFLCESPDSPVKDAAEILNILFGVFEVFSRIGKRVVSEREPLDESSMRELMSIDDNLFEAKQKANNAGDRGVMFLYTINQLWRLKKNFLNMGKVQKRDFGRLSGLIALVALIIQMVVTNMTINLDGYLAIFVFFGSLVVSLIAGFGFEALRFRPLLVLYGEAVGKSADKGN